MQLGAHMEKGRRKACRIGGGGPRDFSSACRSDKRDTYRDLVASEIIAPCTIIIPAPPSYFRWLVNRLMSLLATRPCFPLRKCMLQTFGKAKPKRSTLGISQ